MNRKQLINQIKKKKSVLCVGLDTDVNKLPNGIKKNAQGILDFNKAIIDATKDYAVSYKINTAFYEGLGSDGCKIIEKTKEHIPSTIFSIADAKRGDIGNTSTAYAKAFLSDLDFDSITIAPYMGEDSVKPFLAFEDKWAICLGLTSNLGSKDFQMLEFDGKRLYEIVIEKVASWATNENMMFVIGATKAEQFSEIRKIIPNHFLLVPGVGAQGGNMKEVIMKGATKDAALLINSSRGIIYASDGRDFAQQSANKCLEMQKEMEFLLQAKGIID